MGLELGRISGPLLTANLLRNGNNLAFEDDLIYLDVNNLQVGIKTASPSEKLNIDGTARTNNLIVDTKADIADLTFQLNQIQNRLGGAIYIAANGVNGAVSTQRIEVGAGGVTNLRFDTTDITNTIADSDIEIKAYSLTDFVNFNTNRFEVTGNLHATGTITADGNIIFGSGDTDTVDFNADIASDVIPNASGEFTLGNIDKQWQQLNSNLVNGQLVETSTLVPSGVDMLLTQGSIYYVSINGDDTYLGTHLHNTFRSVKHALSVATTGDEIIIFPGTYTEIFPLTIPQGVSVRGMGIRSVTIEPTVGTNDKDCFLMNGETIVSFLTVKNFYYNATNNTGYAFRFANGIKTTTRSPYVQYITTITQGSVTTLSDPRGFDQGDAGRGALADGAVCDPLCRDPAMLFHAVTFICPNADGITATNGVRIEWLNSFTYFANRGIHLLEGTPPSGSLNFSGSNYLSLSAAQTIGTQAYTFECFFYTASNGLQTILGATASGGMSIWLLGNGTNPVTTIQIDRSYVDAAQYTVSPITINTWHHIAVTRDSLNNTSVFLDGVKATGSASNATNYTGTSGFIGAVAGSSYFFTGYLTQIKLAIGSNYYDPTAANILVPTAVLTTSTNTKLLLTAATSVVFLTDTSGIQTVSNVGGVNYNISTPFLIKAGAEFRSIGSANVYGNYGAVADGANTLGYLIGHNFGYIGAGKDSRNDYGLVVQSQEIVELNSGVLYYDSMDHKGDYRVGDIFYVNQETGAISFNAQTLDFTAGGSIVFEGDGAGVTINAAAVLINYIRIYDNNIDSTVGPVNFYATSGTTTLNTQVTITGNLGVSGDVLVKGNVFLGDNPLDTVNVIPRLTQTIEPDINDTYTLGTNTKRWKTAFLKLVNIDDIIQLANNEVKTLTTDTNLQLVAAGTGKVNVTTTNVEIANNLTVATLNVNGDTTLQDVVIATPTLTTTQVSQNISGTSGPTGFFFYGWQILHPGQTEPTFSAIQPGWTVVGQPTWVVSVVGDGVSNYDITITGGVFASGGTYSFTGYVNGPATINLVGDINLTGNITQTGNVQIINITGHDYLQSTNIKIDGNVIQVTDTDTDINFTANGIGGVKIDQKLKFVDSIISNVWASPTTNTQRSILFTPNGSGSVVVDKTNALTIPYGNNSTRTLTAPGEIRQNSTNNFYEGLTAGGMVSFIGLYDTNKGSYITAELTPGTNDNILRFGINGAVKSTINTTTMSIDNVFVDDIRLNGNTINNRISGNDLIFAPNGTGLVNLNNVGFGDNSIVNPANGALTLQSTGTGYIKFGGTQGVVIPSGDNADRRLTPESGEVRHNTQLGYMEVFNGSIWIPAVGTLGAAPLSEVLDIMDLWSLVLG